MLYLLLVWVMPGARCGASSAFNASTGIFECLLSPGAQSQHPGHRLGCAGGEAAPGHGCAEEQQTAVVAR